MLKTQRTRQLFKTNYKNQKLKNLTNPQKYRIAPLENQNGNTVVTIRENLPLSDAEKSVLSKGLNSVPMYSQKTDEFTTKQDVEKFLRRVQLKADKQRRRQSDTTEKDAFETLTTRKSKRTPPEGQFGSTLGLGRIDSGDVGRIDSGADRPVTLESHAFISNLKFTNLTTQAVQLFQHAVAQLNLSQAI